MKKAIRDVTDLPTYSFGAGNPLWWGNIGFMVIEGLAFTFAFATYLYLYNQNDSWPLGSKPSLFWASLFTVTVILSEVPNIWLKRAAQKHDLKKVRRGLIAMSALGLFLLGIRCFEFTALNIRWDENAYGSIVWFLLGYHTTHLLTDLVETIVMTVCLHFGPIDMRRFPEVVDSQDYWHFVVAFWLATYWIIYWMPRWFEVPA